MDDPVETCGAQIAISRLRLEPGRLKMKMATRKMSAKREAFSWLKAGALERTEKSA